MNKTMNEYDGIKYAAKELSVSENELLAMIEKLLAEVNLYNKSKSDIDDYLERSVITINEGRNGKLYLYYMDDDGYYSCLDVVDQKFVESELIEELFE